MEKHECHECCLCSHVFVSKNLVLQTNVAEVLFWENRLLKLKRQLFAWHVCTDVKIIVPQQTLQWLMVLRFT